MSKALDSLKDPIDIERTQLLSEIRKLRYTEYILNRCYAYCEYEIDAISLALLMYMKSDSAVRGLLLQNQKIASLPPIPIQITDTKGLRVTDIKDLLNTIQQNKCTEK